MRGHEVAGGALHCAAGGRWCGTVAAVSVAIYKCDDRRCDMSDMSGIWSRSTWPWRIIKRPPADVSQGIRK